MSKSDLHDKRGNKSTDRSSGIKLQGYKSYNTPTPLFV